MFLDDSVTRRVESVMTTIFGVFLRVIWRRCIYTLNVIDRVSKVPTNRCTCPVYVELASRVPYMRGECSIISSLSFIPRVRSLSHRDNQFVNILRNCIRLLVYALHHWNISAVNRDSLLRFPSLSCNKRFDYVLVVTTMETSVSSLANPLSACRDLTTRAVVYLRSSCYNNCEVKYANNKFRMTNIFVLILFYLFLYFKKWYVLNLTYWSIKYFILYCTLNCG